jgi:hypothetical protein
LAALLAAGVDGPFLAGQAAIGAQGAPPASPGDAHDSRVNLAGSAAPLLDFRESEIKFSVASLMSTLRDNRHEGWVLAAYPDPKTNRPLIGAGFSLDLPPRDHPQRDPLNPNAFLEPSSAELWAAAGLESARLQRVLERFDRDVRAWSKKSYRRKIRQHALEAELTEDEAMRLLRIAAIQAIHNAKAYCRNFDQLSASQQMALSQLVFQMGVNLEEFTQFLSAVNGDMASGGPALANATVPADNDHWRQLQLTLVQSQWARKYATRAKTVIAMFDPQYQSDPTGAERRVAAMLPAPARHARRRGAAHALRAGNGQVRRPRAHKPRLA